MFSSIARFAQNIATAAYGGASALHDSSPTGHSRLGCAMGALGGRAERFSNAIRSFTPLMLRSRLTKAVGLYGRTVVDDCISHLHCRLDEMMQTLMAEANHCFAHDCHFSGVSHGQLELDHDDTPQADASHDTPQADASHDTPQADASHDTPQTEASHDTPQTDESDDTPQAGDAHDKQQGVLDLGNLFDSMKKTC
jgi:hypothetical protein